MKLGTLLALALIAAVSVACGSEDWNPLEEKNDEKGKDKGAGEEGEIFDLDQLSGLGFEEPATRFQVASVVMVRKEGGVEVTDTATYTYNDLGLVILKEVTTEGQAALKSKLELTYDANGRVLTVTESRQDAQSQTLALSETKTNEYDGDGVLIQSKEESYFNGQKSYAFTSKNDPAASTVTYIFEDYDEGVLKSAETEVCTFVGGFLDGNASCEETDQTGKIVSKSTTTGGNSTTTSFDDESKPDGYVSSVTTALPGKFGVFATYKSTDAAGNVDWEETCTEPAPGQLDCSETSNYGQSTSSDGSTVTLTRKETSSGILVPRRVRHFGQVFTFYSNLKNSVSSQEFRADVLKERETRTVTRNAAHMPTSEVVKIEDFSVNETSPNTIECTEVTTYENDEKPTEAVVTCTGGEGFQDYQVPFDGRVKATYNY